MAGLTVQWTVVLARAISSLRQSPPPQAGPHTNLNPPMTPSGKGISPITPTPRLAYSRLTVATFINLHIL